MPTTTSPTRTPSGEYDFELVPNEKGQLELRRVGQEDVVDVRVRRAFPWSHPELFISVRAKDGKEVLMVDDLSALPAKQAAAIKSALSTHTLIPKVRRILSLERAFDHQDWQVETDRGTVSFRVQEREDVRFLDDGRFVVKDADGNLYELPPLETLDPRSRKHLEFLI